MFCSKKEEEESLRHLTVLAPSLGPYGRQGIAVGTESRRRKARRITDSIREALGNRRGGRASVGYQEIIASRRCG
jgi:hypothetical protein